MSEETAKDAPAVAVEETPEEVDEGTLEVVDEIGEDEPAKEEEASGDVEMPVAAKEKQKEEDKVEKKVEPKKPCVTVDDAIKSVSDFLDVMQQLPTDMLDKLSAAKKAAEKEKEEEMEDKKKKEQAKVVKAEAKPKKQATAVEEKRAPSPKKELSKAEKKKIIPLFGHGYWNLYRTAILINRAMEARVEGVVPTEPYDVFANPRNKRPMGKPFRKGPGSPMMDRGEKVTCKGKITHTKSAKTAAHWVAAVSKSSSLELGLVGPFPANRGAPPTGKPFDPTHFGMPRMCSVSYGKHEEPGGPGMSLGFPEVHGWLPEGIEAWKNRPPSLKALEVTAAELERLSNIQSVALATFLTSVRKMAERHPELCEEFAALEPQVRDLRDLDALMANRTMVNFDLTAKTSKKIVMDGTPIDKDTFRRYWDVLPSRLLFPAVDERKLRRVVPDRRQIEAREREDRERERRRVEEDQRRLLDEEKRRLDEERRMLEEERRMEDERRRREEEIRLEMELEQRRRREEEDRYRKRAEKRPSRRSPSYEEPDRRRTRYENEGRGGGYDGYPSYPGNDARGGRDDGPSSSSAGTSGRRYQQAGTSGGGGGDDPKKRLMEEVEQLLARAKHTMMGGSA